MSRYTESVAWFNQQFGQPERETPMTDLTFPPSVIEKAARGIAISRGLCPDTMLQQNGYPNDLPIDAEDEKGHKFSRMWRLQVPHATAALLAAFAEMERIGMASYYGPLEPGHELKTILSRPAWVIRATTQEPSI